MKAFKRAGSRLSVIGLLSVVALIGASSPASADPDPDFVGVGILEGQVNVPLGVPLDPDVTTDCTENFPDPDHNLGYSYDGLKTTFTFTQTVITGGVAVSRDAEAAAAVGTIAVEAETPAGTNSCDSAALGTGEVEITLCQQTADASRPNTVIVADTTVPGNIGAQDVGTIDCKDQSGDFVRVGSHVFVELDGTTVLGAPGHADFTAATEALVAAEFVGPATDQCGSDAALCIVDAQFAGLFESNSRTGPTLDPVEEYVEDELCGQNQLFCSND